MGTDEAVAEVRHGNMARNGFLFSFQGSGGADVLQLVKKLLSFP
jgi:hypothetical protein